jgi:hypothetical protein
MTGVPSAGWREVYRWCEVSVSAEGERVEADREGDGGENHLGVLQYSHVPGGD